MVSRVITDYTRARLQFGIEPDNFHSCLKLLNRESDILIMKRIIFVFALLLTLSLVLLPHPKRISIVATPNISELDVTDYVKVQPNVEAIYMDHAVIALNAECYRVIATTDPWVAKGIENGLKGRVEFRPSIYDVIKDAFEAFDVKLLMVKIVDLKENTFIGRLVLQREDKIMSLDSRPSDAIALAVRMNADVYMKKDLAKRYGEKVC